jgi:hypothetical protein
MSYWFYLAGLFAVGYGGTAAALGLGGESSGKRALSSFVLGGVAVLLLLPVALVFALSGGLPRVGSVSVKVWAFLVGAAAAGLVAFLRRRGLVGAASGGAGELKEAAVYFGALAVVLLWAFFSGGNESAPGPAAAPAAVQVAPAAAEENSGCECAKGQICTGKRGGRYCLKDDGSKRYISER